MKVDLTNEQYEFNFDNDNCNLQKNNLNQKNKSIDIFENGFKRGNVNHLNIGIYNIKQYLIQSDMEWVIKLKEIIMELDFSPFYEKYKFTGRKSIHPGLILGLIFYGFLEGFSSLRKLELFSKKDVGAWWLMEGIQPDHSTIGKFLQLHKAHLSEDFFIELTKKIITMLNINTNHVACDGTIIDSMGSRFKELKIEALKEMYIDENTDFKKKAQIEKAIKNVEERNAARKNKGQKADVKVCVTDPDSVKQQTKDKRHHSSYKPSILADENRIILGFAVDPSSENKVIKEMLEQYKEINGGNPKFFSADAGYLTMENIQFTKDEKINFLCPSGKEDNWIKKKPEGKFDKTDFKYDKYNDIYICPNEKILNYVGKGLNRQKNIIKKYQSKDCSGCPLKEKCTTSKMGRTVSRRLCEDDKLKHLEKMNKLKNKKLYKKRKGMVEPVFSEIKENFNYKKFKRAGIENVRMEFALCAIANNIKRYFIIKRKANILAFFHFLSIFEKIIVFLSKKDIKFLFFDKNFISLKFV